LADNDQPDSLILRQLRAMDIKVDIIRKELQALNQHSVGISGTLLALRKDIQNLDERVARIETRLDLRELAR
jgi:hypothetical protein